RASSSHARHGAIGYAPVQVDRPCRAGRDTTVVQEMGHMHTSADHGAGSFSALRAARTGVNLFVVYAGSGASCSGGSTGWQPLNGGQPVNGPVVLSPAEYRALLDPSPDAQRDQPSTPAYSHG